MGTVTKQLVALTAQPPLIARPVIEHDTIKLWPQQMLSWNVYAGPYLIPYNFFILLEPSIPVPYG